MVLKVNSIIFIFTVVDIVIIILVLIVIDSHGPNSESSSTFRDHKQSPPKGGCVLLGNLSLNFLGDFKSSNRPWSITVNISLMQFLMTHCMKNDQRKWISINIIFWTQISSFIGIWLPSMAPITQGNFFFKSLNYLTVLETFSPFGHLMHCYRSSRRIIFARRFTILKTVYSQYIKLVNISLNCHFCCQIAYLITGFFVMQYLFFLIYSCEIFVQNFPLCTLEWSSPHWVCSTVRCHHISWFKIYEGFW